MKNSAMAMVAAAILSATCVSVGAEMKTEIGPGEGQLDIIAWPGYIERGETMKEFDWVTGLRGRPPAAWSASRPRTPPMKW